MKPRSRRGLRLSVVLDVLFMVGRGVRPSANELRRNREYRRSGGVGERDCAGARSLGLGRAACARRGGRARDRRADAGFPGGGRFSRRARRRRRRGGSGAPDGAGLRAARRDAAGRLGLRPLPGRPLRLRRPGPVPERPRRRRRQATRARARCRRLHRQVCDPSGGRRPRQSRLAPVKRGSRPGAASLRRP